ncbi:hypothetical protein [Methylobacterium sp. AMS5]|uniref:hypothetical protein n=1 Tax=Methylobacterium sp. AMS5 TaxID=925818 RepID=UPI00074F93F8|nr:hypothetical protein [Methylobacterium sp. AMS5]AMB48332.1 hypothetical protein Y590_25525 [Methylobacterium sp. AMS5]
MTDAQKEREKRRLAAIRQCNNAILSLRSLTDEEDPQEMNDLSSEAKMRMEAAIAEIEVFRTLVFTK